MNISNLFADSMWDMLPALMIPMIIFMIPIIGILTRHQQKMAELIHGKGGVGNPEIEMLRREVAELKSLVHQQTMMIDEIAHQRNALPAGPPSSVTQRVDTGS